MPVHLLSRTVPLRERSGGLPREPAGPAYESDLPAPAAEPDGAPGEGPDPHPQRMIQPSAQSRWMRHPGTGTARLGPATAEGALAMTSGSEPTLSRSAARQLLLPLALAQFICSFAGSNMNVMINDMSQDLDTTVQGIQVAITLFLLVMAALMIPGGKLTDRYGRKRCFTAGLAVYGVGALVSAASPGLGVLILGNSVLEGVGTALLIPPVYILATLAFTDLTSRARAFGTISAMAGVGAAAGPLIGGVITTAISWRAAFVFQAVVIAVILVLSRRLVDPLPPDPGRRFDAVGAILSAAGMFFVVFGILQADTDPVLMT